MKKKKPRVDNSPGRPRIEECLPQDALEAIMGYLDRETLCTARLVSKTFCAAASAHVCSLTLASTSKAVSFHRYPHVGHVTVKHACPKLLDEEEESLAQLDPCLRDLATALTVRNNRASLAETRDYLSQAVLMPKLRKLEVVGSVEHEAALLARCTILEAIAVWGGCSISVARTIVRMTQLTSLTMCGVLEDGSRDFSADISWLGHAANLRSLQALSIDIRYGALPLIGNLTGLTGLTVSSRSEEETCSIAPLIRLTRLRSLSIGHDITDSNLAIACSLGSGSLVSLELCLCEKASADCARFLSRQTALTRLSLNGERLYNLRHIGALRIELLQCVELHDFDVLDAGGLSVLCRAPSLTNLSIGTVITETQVGLSRILARLTQLRSLGLTCYGGPHGATKFLDFPLALSSLTPLTKLEIRWGGLDDGDLRALLVLTGLRVLELLRCRLTDAVVPELGVLTNLSSLRVWRCGVTSLSPVSEVLDPLRRAKGLPRLHTNIGCV